MGDMTKPRVGLVGGLGPESTIDYYRRILESWAARFPDTAPGIMVDSLDVQTVLRLAATDRAALIEYLAASLRRLEAADATFIAMTANTPHLVYDELTQRTSLPILSIVETCAIEAKRRGLRRLALLGTRFTMDAPFYPEVFAHQELSVVSPDAADRVWVHERYVLQLLKGDFRDETRQEFVALIERMKREHAIDGVILGGTELPLLLRAPAIAGLPLLDTTVLHVQAIVDRLAQ
jgi:aspartate racemase